MIISELYSIRFCLPKIFLYKILKQDDLIIKWLLYLV